LRAQSRSIRDSCSTTSLSPGLDPISLGVIARLIRTLNDSLGQTSIVVSHDVEECFGIVDYVYFVSDGRIVAQGTPAELRGSGRRIRAAVRARRARRSDPVPLPGAGLRGRPCGAANG
jgi:ABC-type transporter Mla maintaining outer membrane lipid asymmetry ATPase subunit MlaF